MVFTNEVNAALSGIIGEMAPSGTFVIADTNTARLVLPRLDALRALPAVTIPAGDDHKTLATLESVWQAMQHAGVTRRWLVVNVGGGMVTDLGGMAAATFKRGVPCVNVPTTLLGAVDAAVGGKTAVNFGGLKNEIGVFAMPAEVIISTCFFGTLPATELRSGFAEMLKHALLDSPEATDALLDYPIEEVDTTPSFGRGQEEDLLTLLEQSVRLKQRIVDQDPTEHGLRRVLNLGHTVGHALESHALASGHPVPHGYAVAWGLVTELVISLIRKEGLDSALLHRFATRVRQLYGAPRVTCDDYPTLLSLMHHDKKSEAGEINCSLLQEPGHVHNGVVVSDDEMKTALDIFRDLMHMA